jgi:hypothetical protein
MPDEKRSEDRPFRECTIEIIQKAALHILVDPDRQRPWAFDEIVREYSQMSEQSDVEDALEALRGAGLINPVGECYIASRAAVHVYELGILSI